MGNQGIWARVSQFWCKVCPMAGDRDSGQASMTQVVKGWNVPGCVMTGSPRGSREGFYLLMPLQCLEQWAAPQEHLVIIEWKTDGTVGNRTSFCLLRSRSNSPAVDWEQAPRAQASSLARSIEGFNESPDVDKLTWTCHVGANREGSPGMALVWWREASKGRKKSELENEGVWRRGRQRMPFKPWAGFEEELVNGIKGVRTLRNLGGHIRGHHGVIE